MKNRFIFLPLFCALLLGCKQEIIEPQQQFAGEYVLDDGTGLTREYLSFDYGWVTVYRSEDQKYPFAEGKIWNCSKSRFSVFQKQKYSIVEGRLTATNDLFNNRPVEQKDGVLMIGDKKYLPLQGFDANPYSSIDVEKEVSFPYTEQDIHIPYTIVRPIPAGEAKGEVQTGKEWITKLMVGEDGITAHLSGTATDRSGTIKLSYTHAIDVLITVKQAPTTFIRPASESLTIDYMASTQMLGYTIENPVATSTLTATTTASWISDIQVSGTQVSFKVSENDNRTNRSGTLTLRYVGAPNVIVPVTQKWATSSLTLIPSNQAANYTGGSFSFDYTITNPREGVSVTAASQANWITNVAISGNTISYKVAENNTGASRTGTIKLTYGSYATGEFTVTQQWSATEIVLTPESGEIDYKAGSKTFAFEVQNPRQGVTLAAQIQSSWITGVNVSGTNVNYTVAVNNSYYPRTGTIKLTYGSYATKEFKVTQTGKPVSVLNLNKSSLPMLSGTSETLVLTVDPEDAPLQWSSNKTSVATVDQSGRVSAVGNGTATITVKAGDKTATCTVTVTTAVMGVSLNKSRLSLYVGGGETLVATITPSTASNKSVIWSSNKTNIASVDQNGKVSAVSVGTATITVTTEDGDKTANCIVKVIPEGVVDLGLSVFWATCNLGENGLVSSPEQYGAYYAWGETETKTTYDYSTYKFRENGSTSADVKLSKYNTNSEFGDVDNKTVLGLEDDVASAKLGGKWRIPTKKEFEEFINNCKVEWVTYKGKDGYKCTSQKIGFTDRWVFLPAAGYMNVTTLKYEGEELNYWSSSIYEEIPTRAWILTKQDNTILLDGWNHHRCFGRSIRPVYDSSMNAISNSGIDDIIYEEGGKE